MAPRVTGVKAGALSRVAPLYLVVFIGFLGYSLMITVFTPLILRDDGGMLASSTSLATRTLVLGGVLAVYPLAQFVGSPILGALSDRFGRRPVCSPRSPPAPPFTA
jgi:MFS family permease